MDTINTGNQTLTNVVVSDPLTGVNTTIASLAPGAVETISTSYALTQAEALQAGAGQDNRIILTFVQLPQPGVDVATKIIDYQVRPQGQ